MAKYRVHIYATVRVPVEIEEAENHQQAIEAAKAVDLDTLLQHPEFEYAEEITGFLVDEDGDADYIKSRSYDSEGKPEVKR